MYLDGPQLLLRLVALAPSGFTAVGLVCFAHSRRYCRVRSAKASLPQGIAPLKKAALLAARRTAVLVEEAERALLGLVALARQILERLASLYHLAAAHNPTVLVLNEILLLEATGRVLGRSVENLRLGANCQLNHLILWNAILIDLDLKPGENLG